MAEVVAAQCVSLAEIRRRGMAQAVAFAEAMVVMAVETATAGYAGDYGWTGVAVVAML